MWVFIITLCVLSVVVVWFAAKKAPEGYEDNEGFHLGKG